MTILFVKTMKYQLRII